MRYFFDCYSCAFPQLFSKAWKPILHKLIALNLAAMYNYFLHRMCLNTMLLILKTANFFIDINFYSKYLLCCSCNRLLNWKCWIVRNFMRLESSSFLFFKFLWWLKSKHNYLIPRTFISFFTLFVIINCDFKSVNSFV